jgi:hypothetical protein
MRPLLAIVLSVGILGGLALYMRFRDVGRPLPRGESPREVGGEFRLEIATTAPLEVDPFAPSSGEGEGPAALVVRFNGQSVLHAERVAADEPVIVERLPGVVEGVNEVFVEAHPSLDGPAAVFAVRVRVFQESRPVAETTFWSEPRGVAGGTLRFDAGHDSTPHEHNG